MVSLINKISPIENKIREFKAGVDYVLEEEKYHAPQTVGEKKHGTMDIRGYTQRHYKIMSPKLRKTLREILTKKAALLMSFDFKGEQGAVSERFRYNDIPNSYYCQTDDELGYQIVLRDERENQPAQLSIWDIERTEKEKEKYTKHYQAAKRCYEEKTKNDQELTFNIPPQGTKCWRCDKLISDKDISQGRYTVFNNRTFSMIHKIFEHVKEDNCPARSSEKERGFDHYMYFPGSAKKWEKLRKSAWLCRNALEEIRTEMTYNLTYLESCQKAPWNELRDKDISLTKQNLTEVAERLAKIKQTGRYNDCDINCEKCGNILCYHEKSQHDCPAGDKHKRCHGNLYQRNKKSDRQDEPIEKDKNNLITVSNSGQNNQLSEEEKNQIRQYFQTKGIYSITLDGDKLKIVYNDKTQKVVAVNNSQLQQIMAAVKSQPNQSLLLSELQTNTTNSAPDNKLYQGLVIGILSGIILVGLALILVARKKTAAKG